MMGGRRAKLSNIRASAERLSKHIEGAAISDEELLEIALERVKRRLRFCCPRKGDRIFTTGGLSTATGIPGPFKCTGGECLILDPPPEPEDPVMAPLDSLHWKCNWLACFYGSGLANRGVCTGRGRWWEKDCPEYKNEDAALEEWRLRDILFRQF